MTIVDTPSISKEIDEYLAEIARIIAVTYSKIYKPNLVPKEGEIPPLYFRWGHIAKGYYLFASATSEFKDPKIVTTDKQLSDFITNVFYVLTKDFSITWDKICDSKAVANAVTEYIAKHPELNDALLSRDIERLTQNS